MTRRTRNTLLTITLIAAAVLYGSAVWAQDVELPIDTIIKDTPGSVHPIATIDSTAGKECVAELTFENDPHEEPSIHLGNDILVGPVTFTDVENGMFQAAGLTFTTTGPIAVAVRLGADGVFSGGFTLEVTCNPPTDTPSTTTTPPTTAPPESSTTTTTPPDGTATTSSIPSVTPTTLSPPPVGGVDTGGGSCADGACDGFSLSPWQTWLGIGVVWALLAVLVWAFIAGATRRSDG